MRFLLPVHFATSLYFVHIFKRFKDCGFLKSNKETIPSNKYHLNFCNVLMQWRMYY